MLKAENLWAFPYTTHTLHKYAFECILGSVFDGPINNIFVIVMCTMLEFAIAYFVSCMKSDDEERFTLMC